MSENGQLDGVVRLSHGLLSVREQFLQLRFLIVSVLVGGLLLGAGVALVLATELERPLQRATRALTRLITARDPKPLPEYGPQEIRLLSQAVNTLVKRLTDLEQNRRQLLSNLVHELGRPLGPLNSAIYVLLGRQGKDPKLRHELLEAMKDEIIRLGRLVDDLAQLQDQVLGTLRLEPQPLALSDWLPRVLSPWREAARQKDLTWEATISPNLPAVEADPDRLAQVVGNLVSNAIKYTSSGGAVSIRASHEEDVVTIRVSDTGAGITPEDQAQIFTPFFRVFQNKEDQPGMGLGLSIAWELVAAHAGQLELESVPGVGSHFTIKLPVGPPTERKTQDISPQPSHRSFLINTI
jgi:signal transduction histidine kinase